MEAGELKPLITALLLPPALPLLAAGAGVLLALRRRTAGLVLVAVALASLWLLSCHAVAIRLSTTLLPAVQALPAAGLTPAQVQAVVVLGGGVLPQAPEYGQAQPNSYTRARLSYGRWLAQRAQLPMAFAGGLGWAAAGTGADTEGAVARRWAADHGATLRGVDDRSRDTAENAAQMAALLQRDGVRRIALVTDAWHMPRAQRAFEKAGFEVVPAPMGFALPRERALLEWMPSAQGLLVSRAVLREWLGLRVARG